jgi:UDP-N-acetyl-D-glucosamine dehydrogenase
MENQTLMKEIVVRPRGAEPKEGRPLERLIVQRTARGGIIGIGYVGLPLAMEFAKENFPVTGFDVDPEKVRSVNAGRSYIPDIPTDALKERVAAGRLQATSDFSRLAQMDAVIVCVPTPLRKTKDPDISYILAAVEQIVKFVGKGQLIVLESTTYPGTTREVVLPALEKKGLRVGRDFYLAFSP